MIKNLESNFLIERAIKEDAIEILNLQKKAFYSEAIIYGRTEIPPMKDSIEEIENDIETKVVLKCLFENTMIASIRCFLVEDTCQITRFCVDPPYQNKGLGSILLKKAESVFPHALRCELWTGNKSDRSVYLYKKHGYKIFKTEEFTPTTSMLYFEKNINSNIQR